MNGYDMERLLLLKDSGEISAKDLRVLEETLAGKPEARGIADEIELLSNRARLDSSEARVSNASIAAIDLAARSHFGAGRLRRTNGAAPFMRTWRPAIYSAAAALLLILSGALIWDRIPTQREYQAQTSDFEWNAQIDKQLSELDEIVTTTLLEYSELADADRDADSLARELMEIEEMET